MGIIEFASLDEYLNNKILSRLAVAVAVPAVHPNWISEFNEWMNE